MRYVIPVLASVSVLLSLSAVAPAKEIFVSPSGNDAWSGEKESQIAATQDGPFATLQRARDEVRKSLESGDLGPHIVTVRGGRYALKSALQLEARDSGTLEKPIVWRAYAGETPVISGALQPDGWTKWKGQIYRTTFPDAKNIAGGVRQVLFEGQRQILARYPNFDEKNPVSGGWAFAAGEGWPMYADKPGEDKRTLEVRESDWRKWSKPEEVEVTVFARYNWWNDRVKIHAVDSTTRKVTLAKDCSYAIRLFDRYYFQNALEELDAPREWYFDRDAGALYFWPPEGKDPSGAALVVAQSLLRIEKGAHDIVWSGFTMEGCNASAINLSQTARCVVENNHLRSVGDWGGHGVNVENGTQNVIRANRIEGVGNCAIVLSGGVMASLTKAENVAEDNEVSNFGVFYKQGLGVNLRGVGNRAIHNHVHHGPRFGIGHSGAAHEIGFNHIHDVCLETEDTGAIYSNGRDWLTGRGTVIHHNYIHDIPGFAMWVGKPVTPHFAWGIYLDDDTGGVDVIGNIVLRCGRGGLHAHNARDCVVTNNLFADNRDWQFDYHGWTTQGRFWEQHLTTLTKGYEEVAGRSEWGEIRGIHVHPRDFPSPSGFLIAGNRFEKNILVSSNSQTPILDVLRVPFDQNVFDYNLYWAPNGDVRTNMRSFGADTGANLASAFVGKVGETPQGWRWSKRTPESSAILTEGENHTLVMALSAEGGSPLGKDQPVIFGEDIELEGGSAYRLRAKLRASISGSAQVGVHCFVPKRPFWTSPAMQREVSIEWADYEWVFSVPKQGDKGWHDEMRRFNVRVGWKAGSGILEVADVQLHKVKEASQWEAWIKNGVDAHSLVTDPLFENMETAQLRKDSPAWKLGFQRIPFEQIGPRAEKLKR